MGNVAASLRWYLGEEERYENNRKRLSELLSVPEVKEYISLLKKSEELSESVKYAFDELWGDAGKQPTVVSLGNSLYFLSPIGITEVNSFVREGE